jgi:hypothetical protein
MAIADPKDYAVTKKKDDDNDDLRAQLAALSRKCSC